VGEDFHKWECQGQGQLIVSNELSNGVLTSKSMLRETILFDCWVDFGYVMTRRGTSWAAICRAEGGRRFARVLGCKCKVCQCMFYRFFAQQDRLLICTILRQCACMLFLGPPYIDKMLFDFPDLTCKQPRHHTNLN